MKASQIKVLVEAHKRKYKQQEVPLFQKMEKFYNNEFFDEYNHRKAKNDFNATDPRTSINLVFATVETAKSLLLGQDIAIAANGHTPEAHEVQQAVSRLVSAEFRRNNMRALSSLALDNALLKRRGIFKTLFDQANNRTRIFTVDPAYVCYDLNAKLPSKSRYWGHLNNMPWRTFVKLIKSGVYKRPGKISQKIVPDKVPAWALLDSKKDQHLVDEVFGIALVWEIYHMEEMKAYHYHEASGSILWEGPIDDHPLAMFSLNHNNKNLDGYSEVELLLSKQQTINNIYTTMHQTIHRMLSRMLVDTSIVDFDEVMEAYHAPAGSTIPVQGTNHNGKSLKEAFFELPTAKPDKMLPEFSNMLIGNAQWETGVNAQSRGGSTNVRTAEEMASINAASRSRVAFREGNFKDGLAEVAERTVRLMKKYGQGPYTLKDENTFTQLNQIDLQHFDGHFDISPYTPVKNNPQMIADVIGRMGNFLVGNPQIDQQKLLEIFLESLGLPLEVQQVTQQQAPPSMDAAAAAADQAAMGNPAEGMPTQEATMQQAREMEQA